MNKKHLIYSFQYAAVLASVLTFSSCKKDEFTAEQALDIENKRKQFQFDLDEKSKDNEAARANLMMWQARKIDSLQKVNAGGQVFYSVTVVPGGSTAFGQGRFEEVGLTGVEVTVEQYGFVITEKTVKGIAYFKKPLFSGEANVTVDAQPQGYTSVSYIANLTPDGGVPNDGTVFVGNIIPVFDNDRDKNGAENNMAMISGKAWADLDLTIGSRNTDNTNPPNEEFVPEGTTLSAVIDVNAPEFKEKYLRENFEEGGIHIGGSGNTPGTGVATKSGFIQRIAYERASTVAKVDGNGNYSLMVSATASGLPMKMRYSDFAADRTYKNNAGLTVTERCLYGPEVSYTGPGQDDLRFNTQRNFYDYDVNLVQVDATVTAALTKGTSPWTYTAASGAVWLRPVGGIDVSLPAGAVAENRFRAAGTIVGGVDVGVTATNNAGAYLHAPAVSFSTPDLAGGVQTVGAPVMYSIKPQGASATTAPAFGTSAFYNSDYSGTRTGALNLRGVRGIALSTVGSGYSTPPVITLTPNFPGGEGTGSLQASSSGISYIRVINGGFGLVYSAGLHNLAPESHALTPAVTNPSWSTTNLSDNTVLYQGVNQFTGVLPLVVINGGIVPSGGALATAQVVANTTIGTIDEIRVTANGNGYSPATSAITFNIGAGAGVETTTAAGPAGAGDSPFIVTNAGGLSLAFNTAGGALTSVFDPGTADGVTTFSFAPGDINFNTGGNYTFVPGVQVLNIFRNYDATAGAYTTAPANIAVNNLEIRSTVRGGDGAVVGLSIIGTPSIVTAGLAANDELRGQFNIVPRQDWPASAQAFLTGSGIDNYVVTAVGANYSNVTAPGITPVFGSTEYDYYTFASGGLGGPDGGSIVGPTRIEDVVSYDLNDGDYDVEFFGATGLAGNPVTNPTAIPVFQSGGSVLAGIRIFSPGVNIAPATGTTPAIRWRVIPRGYKAGIINAQLTPATITFNIVDGGLGYAVRPDIILTTDKLTYVQTAALNDIANFKYNINASGTITSIEFAPNAAGAAAVMSSLNNATVAGTLQTPIITVAPQEADLYAHSSLAAFVDLGNAGGYCFIGDGAIQVGLDIFGDSDAAAWLAYAGNTNNTIMHWPQGTPAFGESGEIPNAYYTGFTMDVTRYRTLVDGNTITGTGNSFGSGGSASAILNPANGQVASIEVVNGGSGYLFTTTFNAQPITRNFTVFGGPDGYKAPGLFETYSGIQYVRDIHYGIGKRIH